MNITCPRLNTDWLDTGCIFAVGGRRHCRRNEQQPPRRKAFDRRPLIMRPPASVLRLFPHARIIILFHRGHAGRRLDQRRDTNPYSACLDQNIAAYAQRQSTIVEI